MNDIQPITLPGIDPRRPLVIAGPCSAETEEQVLDTARSLAAEGIRICRAGLWKPRTKPGGFEGVGEAGIAWLQGGRLTEVAHTVVNALAVTSGIVCDGAKASCAAKIAIAVDAGILGYDMYRMGQEFVRGEGLVSAGVENTIRNIGRLGRDGMRETDREILGMMTSCVD